MTASLGVPVAKHGNKAQSSRETGTADVLGLLGVNINAELPTIERCLAECGMGYMNAPKTIAAMRHVMPARVELGVRTIFNILGPLTNPAGVKHSSPAHSPSICCGPWPRRCARWARRRPGWCTAWTAPTRSPSPRRPMWRPSTAARSPSSRSGPRTPACRHPFGGILGGAPSDNAAKMRALLAGDTSPRLTAFRHAVMLNTAAALLVAGRTATLAEGVPLAAAALDDGRARATLERLVKVSNET